MSSVALLCESAPRCQFEAVVARTTKFAVFGVILAVIARCFPLLFRRPASSKGQRFRGQSSSGHCFFAAFISDISQRWESPARQLTARWR